MSPLMMRLFALVGIALAAASMQSKARAGTSGEAGLEQARSVVQFHASQESNS